MSINPVQDLISAALAKQATPLSRVTTPAPVADTSTTNTVSDSTSVSAQAQALQSSSLRDATVGFAQLGSLLEVAGNGTGQISNLLQQLQSLAVQANSTQTPAPNLNGEFQRLLSQINLAVGNTQFGGTNLLDGTLSGPATNAASLSIPDLSTNALFANTTPNLVTSDSAQAALTAVTAAQAQVKDTGDNISTTRAGVSFAAATVETALANNAASSSTLTADDLQADATGLLASLLAKPGATANAQTGNLPASILSLLQE